MSVRGWVITAVAAAAVIVRISQEDLSDSSRSWAIAATFAATICLVWVVPAAQRILDPGWLPGTLVGVAAVTYLCVPETDQIPYLAVVPATMSVIELVRGIRSRAGWIYGAACLVLWAGVYGATGRQGALVGAFFAWWPLLMIAAAGAIRPALAHAARWRHAVILVGGLVAAGVVARTGALEPTVTPAVRDAAIAAAASLALTGITIATLSARGDRAGAPAAQ